MKKRVLFIILISAWCIFSTDVIQAKPPRDNHAEDQSTIEQMAWLDKTTPRIEFDKNIALHHYFFYACYGFTFSIPGINAIYNRCYADYAKIVMIDGVSDCISSEEHARLIDLAYSFAKEYNQLMAEYLTTHGMTTCKDEKK